MNPSSNHDISSVQPIANASEVTVFGDHRRDDREESQKYEGVQKINDGPMYEVYVRDINDHVTESNRTSKFDKAETAARAHDLVAFKLWGSRAKTNFPETQYKTALQAMADMTQTEVVDTVKRLSFTFSKLMSMYRGVTRYIRNTEEEAGRAFDVESIKLKGHNAITNFHIKFYNVEAIQHGETDEKIIYKPKDSVNIAQIFRPFAHLARIMINWNEEGEQQLESLMEIDGDVNG
ncbi:AP2-like ethylene-responsive transcription factor PLT2 [Abrus precatorius]|uniref:AP2-like ethylene-responsive transcription factor PLT2 n=1 Tax=Abrus precatorius TaxID=3816 RepID=A0A8B8L4G7_ABRPR|nr:AP2-like ethylene-responsive transcription factor PLT2 [Abrus precatorius]